MAQTTNNQWVHCEMCDIKMNSGTYRTHITGKKHLQNQEYFDRVHKSVYVSGVSKFSAEDLENIFKKYGEVSKVTKVKGKDFAFVRFAEKSSVDIALKARIFVGNLRIFVKKYIGKSIDVSKSNDKSRKLSETSSSTSQTDMSEGQPDVDVLPEPEQCPNDQSQFEWQVQHFISQVELPGEKNQSLNAVMNDVQALYRSVLPGCLVMVFGSCGNSLAFKESDVDLYLQAVGEQPKDFVSKEAKLMYKSKLFRIKARIPNARVPIIRFEHLPTGWQCDLTANSKLGVCNSQLIRFLVSLDLRIRPLMMLIKYWAKMCDVTGYSHALTSYALVMLVIFYLQSVEPPLLPSIAQLQRLSSVKEYSLGWECSFCNDQRKVLSECLSQTNDSSLKELLTGFFRFYDTFDYDNVICPLLACTIPSSDFETGNLPEEMNHYKSRAEEKEMRLQTGTNFKVQDPFELCLNITRNVTNRGFSIFKKACNVSLDLCEKEDESTLLKSLFSIDKTSLDDEDKTVTIHIPFMNIDSEKFSVDSENDCLQWFELTTESVLLVMREVLKLKIEPNNVGVSNKVQKVGYLQDVHSLPQDLRKCDDLVYVCNGNAVVWNSRKKMSKLINSLGIYIPPFEREVCISNALYYPNSNITYSFMLTMSSFNKFVSSGTKRFEIIIRSRNSNSKSSMKEICTFLKCNLRCLVLQAALFIIKIKASSSVTREQESLKELIDVKLKALPDLKLQRELKQKHQAKLEKQRNDISEIDLSTKDSVETVSHLGDLKNGSNSAQEVSKKCFSQSKKTLTSRFPKASGNSTENQLKRNVLPPTRNTPSVETEELINKFFNPDKSNHTKTTIENSTNEDTNKFNKMLKSIQKVETKSTFTSENSNPFLAAIEKISVKPTVEEGTIIVDGINADNTVEKDKQNKHSLEKDESSSAISVTDTGAKGETSSEHNKDRPKDNSELTLHRPKLYVEGPYKCRKTDYDGTKDTSVFVNVNSPGVPEYIDGQVSRPMDKHQKLLSRSTDKYRLWYPTLFQEKK